MKKTLLAASLTMMIGLAAGQTSITPGQENVVDNNVTENKINSSQPLNTTLDNGSLKVSPSVEYPPGSETLEVEYANSTQTYDLQVEEYVNWSISPSKFNESVDLGSSGGFEAFQVEAVGNTQFDLELDSSGEVFDYLTVNEEEKFVDDGRTILAQYQVQEGISSGIFNGSINASGMGQNQTLDLSLELVDNIDPEIMAVNASDYNSFDRENFSVEAEDNGKIGSVSASVFTVETVNNSEVLEPYSDYVLNEENNSNVFFKDFEINKPGKYHVDVFVEDESGNQVNESKRFEVDPLDAVDVANQETLGLPVHRKGSQISKKIGEIDPGTDVEITLEDFSEDLEEKDWEVSVLSDSEGPEFFNSVNQSIQFSESANLTLQVEADEEAEFNGRLGFDGGQYHESIDDLTFQGEYLDCPVPQRKKFELLNRNVTLEPESSDKCSEAGWEVSYFAPASAIPSNDELKDSLNVLTPSELKEQQRMVQERIIQEKESSITFWRAISAVFFVFMGVGIYSAAYAVYQKPYMMHFDVSRTERFWETMKRREKLGIGGN